tara:strand:+ start:873 stop:1079 length:207 start_codon:yes stop_codon:yes gene_type:complete
MDTSVVIDEAVIEDAVIELAVIDEAFIDDAVKEPMQSRSLSGNSTIVDWPSIELTAKGGYPSVQAMKD